MQKGTTFRAWGTSVVRVDSLFSILPWLQNKHYDPSQNGNQYSDVDFWLNHQSRPSNKYFQWLTLKQTGTSFHCDLFKVLWPRCSVSRTVNEQTPQLPQASSLITPIQQNEPSNCPDQYYLFCVQKGTYSSTLFPRQLEVFVT